MKVALLLLLLIVLLSVAAFRDRIFAGRGEQDPGVVFKLIEALIRQRPFTLDAVSRITETTMRKADSNEYFATFMSVRGAKTPLRQVELRLPTSASSKKDGMLILSIDSSARITPEAVEKQFESRPDLSVPEPAAPYEFSYTYAQPWGRLSFEFARRTRYLVAVIIDAIESKPAAGRKSIEKKGGVVAEASIGSAWMEADGTIVLQLRAEGPGPTIGDALFRYPKIHPQYDSVLRHLGGLKAGEKNPVPPWPEK
jgi:hypothetical protein